MITNIKVSLFVAFTTVSLTLSTISSPYNRAMGRFYNTKKDYTCCKGNQIVLHHYYSVNVLWIEVANGYTLEKTGKHSFGGCSVRCED